MKIAICDDETAFIEVVKSHLTFYQNDNNLNFQIDSFTDPKDLIESKKIYDIAILDVEMPEYDGIKVADKLRKQNRHIALMFVTAHKKYLDNALDLNAVRFFEKPLDSERFYIGLDNALKRIDTTAISFIAEDELSKKRINAADIVFVEIEKRRTKIVTVNGDIFQSNQSINFWKERLVGTMYAFPHKSYIVNMDYVSEYERDHLVLLRKYQIPISKSNQSVFRKYFLKFMEGK